MKHRILFCIVWLYTVCILNIVEYKVSRVYFTNNNLDICTFSCRYQIFCIHLLNILLLMLVININFYLRLSTYFSILILWVTVLCFICSFQLPVVECLVLWSVSIRTCSFHLLKCCWLLFRFLKTRCWDFNRLNLTYV